MGANYGIVVLAEGETAPRDAKQVLTEKQADEIKVAWREAHPNVAGFWREQERAATLACLSQGKLQTTKSGQIKWLHSKGYLLCRLPSGRVLTYPRAHVLMVENPETKKKREVIHYEGEDALTKRWGLISTYGGKLVENIVQAVSRDLLVGAMFRMEARGWPIVLHVHDEAIVEVPVGSVSVGDFAQVMAAGERWSTGLSKPAQGQALPKMTTMLDVALDYARQGIPVFPCNPAAWAGLQKAVDCRVANLGRGFGGLHPVGRQVRQDKRHRRTAC
jgi:hypothetical protein